ncbi:HlyD family type I secretion periplasmic adaptor subunit [uncultured Sphingomonas sp.]|uniref:HlyD family type I secretion periplasmic adaptor subunit n=1 Tax=uncultured Sphingomonas sp. TaxID=158754 RepID=UPI0035CA2A29
MSFAGFRDRLICLCGGASLFEGVGRHEVATAMGGRAPVASMPLGGLAPWSARIRTERPTNILVVTGTILAIFLVWAALFSVDKVTRGPGRVVPSVQNQVVQHLEGGIVKRLLVEEGQRVRKGQVLLQLSNEFTSADARNARTDVVAKKIALARADAEIAGAADFHAPAELAAIAPAIAASEEVLFHSRRAQMGQSSSIMAEQGRARRADIAASAARLLNLRSEQRLMMGQLAKLEKAYAEEAISEREVTDKRASLLSLQTKIDDVQNSIPGSQAELGEAAARQREVYTRTMEETKEHAAKLRLELSKANENLTAYADKRSREEVRAPMDGVVNKLYFQTVGGVIRAGEPVAEIVPVDQTVIVEARVAPRDRGNVWPGLPASIKISAYDAAVYGGLEGKVIEISPDVIQDPKGESYYRVRLKAEAAGFGRDRPVIAGMTADVAIKAGRQTVLNYLLGPLIGIRDGALRE